MSEETVLLLRRAGNLWGVPRDTVRGLGVSDRGVRVALASSNICVDAVLGLAHRLEVRPAGATLKRFWNEPCRGLAVHDGVPVVVIDAACPPRALLE